MEMETASSVWSHSKHERPCTCTKVRPLTRFLSMCYVAGVRIFFIDSKCILQTMLLAVKLFRPDPSLGKVTGSVVLLWLIQVLAQNGLRKSNIAGAVTDAGADVRTGVGDAFDREWCGPHMANRATIDGTGMSPTKAASKNPRCRELLELCKKVVEFVNRSSSFKVWWADVVLSN